MREDVRWGRVSLVDGFGLFFPGRRGRLNVYDPGLLDFRVSAAQNRLGLENVCVSARGDLLA